MGLYLAALALKAGGARGHGRVRVHRGRPVHGRLPAVGAPGALPTGAGRVPHPDGGAGPHVRAAVRRGPGHHRVGQVLESLEGSNLLLVPLDRRPPSGTATTICSASCSRPSSTGASPSWSRSCTPGRPPGARPTGSRDRDRPRPGRRGRRPGRPAGLDAGPARLRRRTGRHRPPLVRLVRGPGAARRYPPVAVLGAWLQALVGSRRRPSAGPTPPNEGPAAGTLPDGSTVESWLAMLRALLCRDGVDRMRRRHPGRPGRAGPGAASGGPRPSCWRGSATCWPVRPTGPTRSWPGAVEVATDAGALPAAAIALAERSLVAMQRQDWQQAATLAEQAPGGSGRAAGRLCRQRPGPCGGGPGGRAPGRRARGPKSSSARAARLRPLLTYALPYLAVQTLLELGRAYLALDDAAGARVVLRQARDILRRRPDLGILPRPGRGAAGPSSTRAAAGPSGSRR